MKSKKGSNFKKGGKCLILREDQLQEILITQSANSSSTLLCSDESDNNSDLPPAELELPSFSGTTFFCDSASGSRSKRQVLKSIVNPLIKVLTFNTTVGKYVSLNKKVYYKLLNEFKLSKDYKLSDLSFTAYLEKRIEDRKSQVINKILLNLCADTKIHSISSIFDKYLFGYATLKPLEEAAIFIDILEYIILHNRI